MEKISFWSAIAQTMATLAGFTIAGFSIYMATTERAEADDICRRYGFKDDSSRASWAFIFVVLILFGVPLLLSLLKLWGVYDLNPFLFLLYRLVSLVLASLLIIISLALTRLQLDYYRRLAQASAREQEFAIERDEPQRHFRNPIRNLAPRDMAVFKTRIVFVGLALAFTVIVWNVLNVVKAAWEKNHIPASRLQFLDFVSPGSLAIVSMVLGLGCIYFHFHMYRPERLLFVVNDPHQQDMKRFRQGLINTTRQIADMQNLLRPIVTAPDERLLNGLIAEERSQPHTIEKRRKDLAERVEGWSWNAKTGREERLLDRLDYHLRTLDFCLAQPVMRYGAIRMYFKELELFDSGLTKFSLDLVGIKAQLQELSRVAENRERRDQKRASRPPAAARPAATNSTG